MTELPTPQIKKGQILLITRAREHKGLLGVLCVVRAKDDRHLVLEMLTYFNRDRGIYQVSDFGLSQPERDFILAAIGEERLLELEAEYSAA
jgi:hypothetical protein